MERVRGLPQINAIKFLTNLAGKMFGWLKVLRTDYETFQKQNIMLRALSIILEHLVG